MDLASGNFGPNYRKNTINPSSALWLGAPELTNNEVREYFTALGERQLELFNMREDEMKIRLNHEVSILSKELADRDAELSELRQWINSWKALLTRGAKLFFRRLEAVLYKKYGP